MGWEELLQLGPITVLPGQEMVWNSPQTVGLPSCVSRAHSFWDLYTYLGFVFVWGLKFSRGSWYISQGWDDSYCSQLLLLSCFLCKLPSDTGDHLVTFLPASDRGNSFGLWLFLSSLQRGNIYLLFIYFCIYKLFICLPGPGLSCSVIFHLPCKHTISSSPGIEPEPPALGALSLGHWTTREEPQPVSSLSLFHVFSLSPLCTHIHAYTLSVPFCDSKDSASVNSQDRMFLISRACVVLEKIWISFFVS